MAWVPSVTPRQEMDQTYSFSLADTYGLCCKAHMRP